MRLGCDNSVALGFTSVGDQLSVRWLASSIIALHTATRRFLLPLELELPSLEVWTGSVVVTTAPRARVPGSQPFAIRSSTVVREPSLWLTHAGSGEEGGPPWPPPLSTPSS